MTNKDKQPARQLPPDQVETYFNESGELVKKSTSFKAVVLHNHKILLAFNEHTGELGLPGGRARVGENPDDTLNREVAEETQLRGITIKIGHKLHQHQAIFRSPVDNQWRDITYNFFSCTINVISPKDFQDSLMGKNLFYEPGVAITQVKYQSEKTAIQNLLDLLSSEK